MSLAILKRIMKKKIDKRKEDKRRSSPLLKNLPLGLSSNSIIEFNELDFVLLEDVKYQIPKNNNLIKAIGKFNFAGTPVHRFYFDESTFIEVFGSTELEIRYFTEFDMVYPSETDWVDWLDEDKGILGDLFFSLPDHTEYIRMFNSDIKYRIEPFIFNEYLYVDEYDIAPTQVEHISNMYYGRTEDAEGETSDERLIISAVEDIEGACIAIYTGTLIAPQSITII